MAPEPTMTWTIVFGGDPEDVLATTHGYASIADTARFIASLLDDPRFHPGMRVLIDHSDLNWTKMDSNALRARSESLVKATANIDNLHVAIVAGRTEIGILRMIEAFAGGSLGFAVEIFPTREAAREWLQAGSN